MENVNPFHKDGVYYWHGNEFMLLAAIAAGRCKPGSWSLDAKTAQVMAVVAAEAFMGELTMTLSRLERIGKAPDLTRIGSVLATLEDSHVQIVEKFLVVSQLLPGAPYEAGRQPLQSFRHLVKLRNSLVHPRAEAKPPQWFSFFIRNQLTVQIGTEEHVLPDWQRQLQSRQCAMWACRASSRIILDSIERLKPLAINEDVPGAHSMLDAAWSWTGTDSRIWVGDKGDAI